MRGIANDGVGHVLEVAADLVAPPGGGKCLDQRRARGGKTRIAGLGQRELRQPPKACVGVLHGGIGRGVIGLERMVHLDGLRRPATHHRQVALVRGALLKRLRQCPRRIAVQRHHQHAAGALVQPMHRKHMLAQLVAQGLHHKPRLARVQPRAVHQPACGLVHGHQVLVAPKDVQGRGHGGMCVCHRGLGILCTNQAASVRSGSGGVARRKTQQ